MKTRTIKKLWNNLVSLRDYEVLGAIKAGGVVIKFGKYQMTLHPEQLERGFQAVGTQFKSKFGTKDYALIDFRWIPDQVTSCTK